MQSGIYGIHNVINGKWYVGQSTNIPRRKTTHFSFLRTGKHRNEHLQLSFNKHGEASFEFRILEEVAENMMDVRECAWIEYYGSLDPRRGYNLDSGGNLNKHHSEETRKKMGHDWTVEQRLKLSDSVKKSYKSLPEEIKAKRKEKNLRKRIKRSFFERTMINGSFSQKPRFH